MAEQEVDGGAGPPGRRTKLIPYAIVTGLMLAEGLAIFIAMKTLGSDPAATHAQGAGDGIVINGQSEANLPVEHPICELDAFNKLTGKLLLYHVEVAATIDRRHEERFKKLIDLRKSTISDRVTTVIRSADPKYLQEPGLETIRRQIKFELDKVLGDEKIIVELLIPSLLQSSG